MDIGIARLFTVIVSNFYGSMRGGVGTKNPDTKALEHASKLAPDICDDLTQLDPCIDQLCAGFKMGGRRRPEADTSIFRDAIKFYRDFFVSFNWITTRAMVQAAVNAHKDVFCDGESLTVADPVPKDVPVAALSPANTTQRNLIVVGVGVFGILALRMASIHPNMRAASPALIEGIYMWMGMPSVDVLDTESERLQVSDRELML